MKLATSKRTPSRKSNHNQSLFADHHDVESRMQVVDGCYGSGFMAVGFVRGRLTFASEHETRSVTLAEACRHLAELNSTGNRWGTEIMSHCEQARVRFYEMIASVLG